MFDFMALVILLHRQIFYKNISTERHFSVVDTSERRDSGLVILYIENIQ